MTNAYRWVQWNRAKRTYDLVLAAALIGYLASFFALGAIAFPTPGEIAFPVLLIRALGTAAAILLHIILAIGPLARLTPRMAPVLYNRRHLGVTCFAVAALHALLAVGFHGGFGIDNPVLAVLAGPGVRPPFELYGLATLLILFVLAATSHDFWLANLGPRLWKLLHMLVYLAYVLLIAHIAFGAVASEKSPVYPILLACGIASLAALHLLTGLRERARDRAAPLPNTSGWIDLGSCEDIPVSRARVVCLPNAERVAVFRDGDHLHAVTNVCAHQGGPLGEGKILDGCITCPWHGYQFRAHDGCSPPPYTEKIATYELRVEGGRVRLNPTPNRPGTPTAPTPLPTQEPAHG